MDRSRHIEEPEPSDEVLVERARDGVRDALDLLIRRHEARVLRVLRLMGVRPADREDVAQEVFLRVFQHLGSYRAGHAFGGWIYRITVNAAHDHRARSARRRADESDWIDGLDQAASGAPGPGRQAEARAEWQRLEGALEALSPRERAVFVLCELEELSSRDAARALEITQITVRRHLGRARRHLQRVLGGEKKSGGR